MKWTRKHPEASGYYGFRSDMRIRKNIAGEEITVIAVRKHRGLVCAIYSGNNRKPVSFMDGWWCGPLEFPPVPGTSDEAL